MDTLREPVAVEAYNLIITIIKVIINDYCVYRSWKADDKIATVSNHQWHESQLVDFNHLILQGKVPALSRRGGLSD